MPTLQNYYDVLVIQRQLKTGCIPSGIEWMLKYLNIVNINYDNFQEKYDLLLQGKGDNHFGSIPPLVMKDYSNVILISRQFQYGEEKIEFIRNLISRRIPVLISVALSPSGGWHIVPVVEIDDVKISLLSMVGDTIQKQIKKLQLSDVENRHNNWRGGQDILYCDKIKDEK